MYDEGYLFQVGLKPTQPQVSSVVHSLGMLSLPGNTLSPLSSALPGPATCRFAELTNACLEGRDELNKYSSASDIMVLSLGQSAASTSSFFL